MGKILRADNRLLPKGQPYSYLTQNYSSGQSSMAIENSNKFAADQYVILSEFGSESSEIMQIQSVNTSTHTLTFTGSTKFSHAESTKVCVIPFDQVKYYYCTDTSYVGSIANSTLLSTSDVEADSLFTAYEDTAHSSNYGWLVFYNSTTTDTSSVSNTIKYGGTDLTDVKYVFDQVLSQLNNKEKKLISNDELFAWLNNGYTKIRNAFNLVNRVDNITDKTITPSTQESSMDDNFFRVVSLYDDSSKTYLKPIEIKEIEAYKDISGATPRYYVRKEGSSTYLGIVPVQDGTKSFILWQETQITRLTKYSDSISIPDGNIWPLINFMTYKAMIKLQRSDAISFLQLFENDIKAIKEQSAIKIEAGDDSWEPDPSINI